MNLLRNLLIGCMVLTLNFSLSAQWKDLGLPYGYSFNSSYIDLNGNILLECTNDIYYSNDFGLSWIKTGMYDKGIYASNLNNMIELQNNDLLFSINNDVYQFNKSNYGSDLIVSGLNPLINIDHQGYLWYKNTDPTKIGVKVSKDKGLTYEFIEGNDPKIQCDNSLIESYKDKFNIMLSRCSKDCALYKFNDKGEFNFLQKADTINFLYIDQVTGTIYTVNEDSKVCRSSDGGNSFTPINAKNNWIYLDDVIMRKLGNGALLLKMGYYFNISFDDGITWNNLQYSTTCINYPGGYPVNSVIIINGTQTLVATANDYCSKEGVYKSINSGKNWSNNKENFFQPRLDKLLEDKEGNLYSFNCSDTTILVNKGKGKDWVRFLVNSGGKKYAVHGLDIDPEGNLYAVTRYELFKSDDGGESFVKVNNNEVGYWDGQSYDIYIAPNGYIYMTSGSTCYLSKDKCNTWEGLNIYGGFDYNKKVLKHKSGDVYYVDSQGRFLKYNVTTDTRDYFDVNIKYRVKLYILSENGLIYYTAQDTTTKEIALWVSEDNMNTYTKLANAPGNITTIFTDNNNRVYVNTINGIYVSNDLGKSFVFFATAPESDCEYYVSSFQNLFAFRKIGATTIYTYPLNLVSGSPLSGIVYLDEGSDCINQKQELTRSGIHVSVEGSSKLEGISGKDGKFNLKLQEGNYSISTVTPNPLWKSCPASTFNISKNQLDTLKLNVSLTPQTFCPYLSIQVQTPYLRRCNNNNYINLKYCNEGTLNASNVNLSVELPEKLSYLSSTVNPSSQAGKEIKYDLGAIPAGICGDIILQVEVNCSADLGEMLCIDAEINPVDICSQNLEDLSKAHKCYPVLNAYDPNTKTAFIDGMPVDGKTEQNKDVEYLITFQNTGNDTAFRVVVEDQIPNGYDISTLKLLNSSHPFTVEIENERNVKFIFDPIMLPDSSVNEPASHGFIAFKISPDKDLPYGTKLDNYADIYFDLNKAVATNTAYLTVTQKTATTNLKDNLAFSYYPNPTRGELNIHVSNDIYQSYTLRVTNMLGKELVKETYKGSSYKMMSKSSMLPGIYFLSIKGEDGKMGYGKFVVE